MERFEVVQRLAAVATTYDVRVHGTEPIVLVVRGAPMSLTPKFVITDPGEEKELASLQGNFNKTEFHVHDVEKKEVATVTFPSIALKKTLSLKVGDKTYTADAGVLAFEYDFKCQDAKGNVAIEVKKKEGLTHVRDRFVVECGADMPREVAVLITVAIHSRYFEMV